MGQKRPNLEWQLSHASNELSAWEKDLDQQGVAAVARVEALEREVTALSTSKNSVKSGIALLRTQLDGLKKQFGDLVANDLAAFAAKAAKLGITIPVLFN